MGRRWTLAEWDGERGTESQRVLYNAGGRPPVTGPAPAALNSLQLGFSESVKFDVKCTGSCQTVGGALKVPASLMLGIGPLLAGLLGSRVSHHMRMCRACAVVLWW